MINTKLFSAIALTMKPLATRVKVTDRREWADTEPASFDVQRPDTSKAAQARDYGTFAATMPVGLSAR